MAIAIDEWPAWTRHPMGEVEVEVEVEVVTCGEFWSDRLCWYGVLTPLTGGVQGNLFMQAIDTIEENFV